MLLLLCCPVYRWKFLVWFITLSSYCVCISRILVTIKNFLWKWRSSNSWFCQMCSSGHVPISPMPDSFSFHFHFPMSPYPLPLLSFFLISFCSPIEARREFSLRIGNWHRNVNTAQKGGGGGEEPHTLSTSRRLSLSNSDLGFHLNI